MRCKDTINTWKRTLRHKRKMNPLKNTDDLKTTTLLQDHDEFLRDPVNEVEKVEIIKNVSRSDVNAEYSRHRDKMNVLSSVDLCDKHVLMWDFDSKFNEYRYELLNNIVKKNYLDLFIFETPRGIHIIDFHLFGIIKLDKIQKRINLDLKSDYPTILKVKELDDEQGQEFKGTTLRINEPYPKLICRISAKNILRPYSKGHVDLYKLLLGLQFEIEGKQLDTSIRTCSFLRRNFNN